MRVAVTYENGLIFQHFGHTEVFKLYDITNGAITHMELLPANGFGHGALAAFLKANNVDVLICGGIGGGAVNALGEARIQVYGGIQGPADLAVQALLAGDLKFDPTANCSHHGSGHHCGGSEHHCGEHGCSHE